MAKSKQPSSSKHFTLRVHKRAAATAAVALVALGGFSVYAYNQYNKPLATISTQPVVKEKEVLPDDLSEILSFDAVKKIATEGTDLSVSGVELDAEDSSIVFKVVLSNGELLILDAVTGQKLANTSIEAEENDDEPLPADAKISLSFEEARARAMELYPESKLRKIELQVEDGVVVYSVRFQDKARVDINAETGKVVRTKDPKVEKDEKKKSTESSSSSTSNRSDDDSQDEDDDSSKTRTRSGSSGSGSSSRSGSDDRENESEDEDNEIRVEGTLFVSNSSYKISAYGTTYTIQYDESLSGLVGKLVRVEGELRSGNVIVADDVEDRS